MIIENSKISYLHDKNAEKRACWHVFPLAPDKSEKPSKRHIYLHTFTTDALGYNGINDYNALVISDL